MTAPLPPAGWYPYPQGEVGVRWFDGRGWVASTATNPPTSKRRVPIWQGLLTGVGLASVIAVLGAAVIQVGGWGGKTTTLVRSPATSSLTAAPTVTVAAVTVTGASASHTAIAQQIANQLPIAPPTGLVQVGLYSWSEIEDFQTQVKGMGPTVHRVGTNGGMDDATFAACLDAGVQVMETIYPTDGLDSNADPTPASVQALLNTQLTRYGPNGTYWHDNPNAPYIPVDSVEILNEPNVYLSGSLQQEAQTYAAILVAAYPYVKANWPTVKVVGGSVSDPSADADAFLSALYAANPQVFKSFDVFSYHPYTGGDVPAAYYAPDQTILESWGSWQVWTQLAEIRNNLTGSYGAPANVPIWITEIGFPISKASGGTFSTTGGTVTLTEQAAYNVRTDIFCARQGIARCFHMYIDDADGFNGGYYVNPTIPPRPVATATAFMLSLIKSATSLNVIAENYGCPGPFIYEFVTPTQTAIVAWSQTAQTVSIPVGGNAAVYDMFGDKIATATSSYSVALTESPVWLVW